MTMTSTKQNTFRHVPQRTCVACRQVKAKQELVRLVCVADGTVEVDISGKKPGRGAYLCRSEECWEEGCRGGRLEYALRTSLDQDNRQRLLDWMKNAQKGTDG